ncbi:hypothetical protein MMC07_004660 [Pseudocyphellaria aurata]|nr:hypothetical protein [Pseudocyphellaria aurata]
MLWRVQISLRRKLGLAGIFSLTVFIMIIAIIRVTIMYDNRDQADGSWLWTWSFVEQTVAMIIACLASFRALFTQQSKSQRVPQVKGYTGRTLLRNSKTKPSFGLGSIEKGSTVVNTINTSSSRLNNSSEVTVLPPNGVHVRNDYYVISDVENSQTNSVD